VPSHAAESNWSGNYTYTATAVHRPRDLDELVALVSTGGRLQVLGTRHTFTSIGDSAGLIALGALEGARHITVDREAMTVSVGPGVTYAALADTLNGAGLALANLASLPHISVAGAVATATHGSGDKAGNLATSVVGMRLVTGGGDVIDFHRGDESFDGLVVHLGKLGVVTEVTLAVEPYYELCQQVYEGVPWDELWTHFDEITAAGRSVSVFHRFGDRTRQVWVKYDADAERPADRSTLFGARAAQVPLNPVPGADPANCTVQLGVRGPWSERLPHFRSGFTPSSGEEIQSELFVARGDAPAAVAALMPLAPRISPLLLVAELRTIAADSLWLSPQYRRDSVGLHFTWRRRQQDVETVMVAVEEALAPFGARPHWGKLFTAPAVSVAARYPRWRDYLALRDALDPQGVFVNEWLRRLAPDDPISGNAQSAPRSVPRDRTGRRSLS
jgi:xylitol oxidase